MNWKNLTKRIVALLLCAVTLLPMLPQSAWAAPVDAVAKLSGLPYIGGQGSTLLTYDCGNGVNEITLSLETVRLLKSKGDAVASQIKIIWKDAAKKYSEGTKGYLSMIGSLSADPKRSKELADNIGKLVAGDPTIAGINNLVSDVAEAKQIVEAFSLNPEIELFLKKVSAQQATVVDLTPNVLTWLKEKNLTSKLRVRF